MSGRKFTVCAFGALGAIGLPAASEMLRDSARAEAVEMTTCLDDISSQRAAGALQPDNFGQLVLPDTCQLEWAFGSSEATESIPSVPLANSRTVAYPVNVSLDVYTKTVEYNRDDLVAIAEPEMGEVKLLGRNIVAGMVGGVVVGGLLVVLAAGVSNLRRNN